MKTRYGKLSKKEKLCRKGWKGVGFCMPLLRPVGGQEGCSRKRKIGKKSRAERRPEYGGDTRVCALS